MSIFLSTTARRHLSCTCAVVLRSIASLTNSQASLLSGSFVPEGDTDYNLTALGTSDWALLEQRNHPRRGRSATNGKSGASLISDIVSIGGGGLRGSVE